MRPHRLGNPLALILVAALAALAGAPAAHAGDVPVVTPESETPTLFDDEAGGNADADDPAIWRNRARPGKSLVIATAKEGGLRVYDLRAREVQSLAPPKPPGPEDEPGRFNNVDVLTGFRLPSGRADVAVVSDRGNDKVRIYRIDPSRADGPLTDITDPAAPAVFSADQDEINEQRTAYGLTTWKDRATGRTFALVSRRNETRMALLELRPTASGTVGYRTVRTLDLPWSFRLPDGTTWTPCDDPGEGPQVEGMVVDPANGVLYAGQEDVGIWRMPADLTGAPTLVDKVKEYGIPGTYDEPTDECIPGDDPGYGGKRLAADVEGLTLLRESDGDGYLIASSQGDDSFVLYDREIGDDNEFEGNFRVGAANRLLDGSEECDGAAVINAPLGSLYPDGLLVVQDGHDTPAEFDENGEEREATGFTFVDLGDVMDRVDP